MSIKVIVTWVEDNYGAYCEALPGCVATHQDLEELKTVFAEAVDFHLEGMMEDGEPIPSEFQGEYELYFELNVQALLKRYSGIITRSGLSKASGINEKQLGHYASGVKQPRPATRKKIVEAIHRLAEDMLTVS